MVICSCRLCMPPSSYYPASGGAWSDFLPPTEGCFHSKVRHLHRWLVLPSSILLSRPMTTIPRCLGQTQKLRNNLSGTAPFVWMPYGWIPQGDTNQRRELRVSGIAMRRLWTEADERVWEVLEDCSVRCTWEWRVPAQGKSTVLPRVIIYLWVIFFFLFWRLRLGTDFGSICQIAHWVPRKGVYFFPFLTPTTCNWFHTDLAVARNQGVLTIPRLMAFCT